MSDPISTDSKDESGEHAAAGSDMVSELPAAEATGSVPNRKVRVLCPYCGRATLLGARCEQCRGLLDPLSRQATQNTMGPWFIHDPQNPFRPGCSYDIIRDMVRRGRITAETVLRGPTTRQYWMLASRAPSVANLMGKCHNCLKSVEPGAVSCPSCGADFSPDLDRQFLGLGPVHLLPGQASPEEVARVARHGHTQATRRGETQPSTARPAANPVVEAGARSADEETGEYRALLRRMERLEGQLGTSRALLAVSGLLIVVLIAAVLWTSGILFGKPQLPATPWSTAAGTEGSDRSATPPSSAPATSPEAQAPARTAPDRSAQPQSHPTGESRPPAESPTPPSPDQIGPDSDSSSPPQSQESPASPASPPHQNPRAISTSQQPQPDTKATRWIAEWAQLRGLP